MTTDRTEQARDSRTRVLIAVAPRMYRETVAFTPRDRRPGVKVEAVSPEDLDREAASVEPDVLVCHDDASPDVREGVPYRVEILYTDSMNARVVVDGREETVEDIGVERMLSVVDAVGKRKTSSSSSSPG
jgi:hypothetical protein